MSSKGQFTVPDIDSSFMSRVKTIGYIWVSSLPQTIYSFSGYASDLLSLHYIGTKYENEQLAAFGLTLTWIFSFGLCSIASLSVGISTFVGQAYGAKDLLLVRKLLKMGLLLTLPVIVLLSIFIFFSADMLKLCGIDHSLANASEIYFRTGIPAFINWSILFFFRFFAVSLGHFQINGFISVLCIPVHWGCLELLMEKYDIGVSGATYAKAGSSFFIMLMIWIYYVLFNVIPSKEQALSSQNHRNVEDDLPITWQNHGDDIGFKQFCKQSLSHGCTIYVQFVFLEVVVILVAAFCSEESLSSLVITVNIYKILMPFAFGVNGTLNTVISVLIGERLEQKAKQYFYLSMITVFVQGLALAGTVLALRNWMIPLYSDVDLVQDKLRWEIPISLFYMMGDALALPINQVLRCLNEPKYVLKVYLLSFFVLSMGSILAVLIFGNDDLRLVWGGILIGSASILIFSTIKIVKINWSLKMDEAMEEIGHKNETKKSA